MTKLRTTIQDFRFMKWQLELGGDVPRFTPHYESDEYTASELRLIADELDRLGGEKK